jgi:hypothetical protein
VFNSVNVSFPTSAAQPDRVHTAYIQQGLFNHEFATIQFRDWGVDISRVMPGTPITLNIGKREFVGYVHHIEGDMTGASNFIEVSAIGASYVMRQASQDVFRNVTASEIAQKIAIENGFSYKIEPHPRVYPQISQAGLTDWEFLRKLAKQCGYSLNVEGTTLYFQPHLKEFTENLSEALYFTRGEYGMKSAQHIYEFNPVVGETLSHGLADKSAVAVTGVDPRTAELIQVTRQERSTPTRKKAQTELFDRYATTVVVNDFEVATYEAEAADENSKFPYRATAVVFGDSRLLPGKPVYLDTIGSYSGYWTVLETEHRLEETELNYYLYTTYLVLGTDSLGSINIAGAPASPSTFQNRTIKPNVRQTRETPKNQLISSSPQIKPTSDIRLVTSKNRTAPNKKSFEVSNNTWSSNKGNLIAKKAETRRSPVVIAKIERAI